MLKFSPICSFEIVNQVACLLLSELRVPGITYWIIKYSKKYTFTPEEKDIFHCLSLNDSYLPNFSRVARSASIRALSPASLSPPRTITWWGSQFFDLNQRWENSWCTPLLHPAAPPDAESSPWELSPGLPSLLGSSQEGLSPSAVGTPKKMYPCLNIPKQACSRKKKYFSLFQKRFSCIYMW